MSSIKSTSSVSISYAQTGKSTKNNELGMRGMQERAYDKRGEQYLLIKSPPASGKSRALMFIALDKIHNQGIKKAIIVVPEKSIGSSFADEPLSKFGFWTDWKVNPNWNLCNDPRSDGGKTETFGKFLNSSDQILVCTHATFRFSAKKFGIEALDDCVIAVDEFHHVSANPDNQLGDILKNLIKRDKVHIVAMTGSYFRGDAEPVLAAEDEAKFKTVTYTYYEQLNGYEHLKTLDVGYYFYSGAYSDEIMSVLNPSEKTIIHIPSVNSKESTKDKFKEYEHILDELAETYKGEDPETGFDIVKTKDGSTLRIANLVDDNPSKRDKVVKSLKDPAQKNNRDYVDIIIALGMAKEGFDWIWCEHALTVGYRASLTEVVQIIGRTTRDAKGKSHARFTNLIAEPDATEETVKEAVNDTLKAIAASLLMEQVLAPRFNFKSKKNSDKPKEGYDYGKKGYQKGKTNTGYNDDTGEFEIEIKGLVEPKSEQAKRICKQDINEIIAAVVQDQDCIERGMFDEELVPEEMTQLRIGNIIKDKFPTLDDEDKEAVRQHTVATMNLTQKAKKIVLASGDNDDKANTSFVKGIQQYALDVRELDIDLIDQINPFSDAYAILSKTMSETSLKQIAATISVKKIKLSEEEALILANRAVKFQEENERLPDINSSNPWEKKMAEGIAYLQQLGAEDENG